MLNIFIWNLSLTLQTKNIYHTLKNISALNTYKEACGKYNPGFCVHVAIHTVNTKHSQGENKILQEEWLPT